MTKVLITGATGNVGIEVLYALKKLDHQLEIYAGVRHTEFGNEELSNFNINKIKFDFINIETFLPALKTLTCFFCFDHHKFQTLKNILNHSLK